MKTCSACCTEKPTSDFSPSKKGLFGRVSQCKRCRADRIALSRQANPEQHKGARLAQYQKHRAKRIAESMAWNAANRERHLATMARYMAKTRDKNAARTRQWGRDNLARKLAHNKARAKRVREATPPWIDMAEIRLIYLNCPPGHEVDHIYPLKGKTSCGLHVPWNLQYLPKFENRSKHAKEPIQQQESNHA